MSGNGDAEHALAELRAWDRLCHRCRAEPCKPGQRLGLRCAADAMAEQRGTPDGTVRLDLTLVLSEGDPLLEAAEAALRSLVDRAGRRGGYALLTELQPSREPRRRRIARRGSKAEVR